MFTKGRLSLDIRGNILKVVEGSLIDDDIVRINKSAYLDIKSINYKDDRIVNCQENVEVIKNFLRRHKFSSIKTAISISDSKIISRVIKILKLPLNELTGLIHSEAPKYFPVDLNRFYVDYKILNALNDDGKFYYNVLVCAVPRDLIIEYTDLFTNCGLKLTLIDTHLNSISRLYQFLEFEDVVVIDGSTDRVDLIILNKGNFNINTSFDFELNNYTELYRNPGSYDSTVLETQIFNLSKNIQSYLNFYLSKNEDKNIDALYITGDLALINGIEALLQRYLKVNIIKGFDKYIRVIKSKKTMDIDENFFSGNIGMYLRGV